MYKPCNLRSPHHHSPAPPMKCYCEDCCRRSIYRASLPSAGETYTCPACRGKVACRHCNGAGCEDCEWQGICKECGGFGMVPCEDTEFGTIPLD